MISIEDYLGQEPRSSGQEPRKNQRIIESQYTADDARAADAKIAFLVGLLFSALFFGLSLYRTYREAFLNENQACYQQTYQTQANQFQNWRW